MTALDCLFMGEQTYQVHTATRDIINRVEEIGAVVDNGGLPAVTTEAPLLLEALMKLHNLVYYIELHRARLS